jgi:hypothetical protein
MNMLRTLRVRRLQSLAVALGLSAAMLSMGTAGAADGIVTVTGTNTARLSITISDPTAAFGANLGPDGSNTGGEISSVTSTNGNEGAYYIWSPESSPLISIKSNQEWDGTVAASENSGSATSISVASGALRYGTSVPADYATAAGGTAFQETGVAPDATWNNHARGVSTFHYYYFLRVDWTDDLGTFNSTVTYSVSN